MNLSLRTAPLLFTFSIALIGCGGGRNPPPDIPLNTDYSSIKPAASRDTALVYAKDADDILDPLRNGVRLSLSPNSLPIIAGVTSPNTASDAAYSRTTIQIQGVDEADLVKYDGHHIFSVRPEVVPAQPGLVRHVLKIAKTNPTSGTIEVASEFVIQGEHSTLPVIYALPGEDHRTQYIAAINQNFQGWMLPQPQASALVVQPDRTKVQLLDVRDPYNVSQAWEVELDGWLRATRKIGDTLYLVNSYRPRLAGLELPADTQSKKEANERRIRTAGTQDLLPRVRVNGGVAQSLASPADCVLAADLRSEEAYTDLLVITSVDLVERRVRDVACVSTDINGVFVAHDALYVGGEGAAQAPDGSAFTVLHKFALADGNVSYRATGVVGGRLPWNNAAYFMDQHEGRLRIVTSQHSMNGHPLHRLSVLEETPNHGLALMSLLPSPEHPEPIGKPGDQVHAVRFFNERAYVVTARTIDPLYVIDLSDPFEPFIAGELEVPGVSTYLQPLDDGDSELLLSIGRDLSEVGTPQGVKVELFDVSEIELPRSLGAHVFGKTGSFSEAIDDPHALTVQPLPGEPATYRIGLPIDIYETPHPSELGRFVWSYSGFQLLEVSNAGGSPGLHVQGVLKTDESSSPGSHPNYVVPRRVVLHADGVFGVNGGLYATNLWDAITSN
jgi:hypothetical protein